MLETRATRGNHHRMDACRVRWSCTRAEPDSYPNADPAHANDPCANHFHADCRARVPK